MIVPCRGRGALASKRPADSDYAQDTSFTMISLLRRLIPLVVAVALLIFGYQQVKDRDLLAVGKTPASDSAPLSGKTVKAPQPGKATKALSPVDDPQGVHPGLQPVPKDELGQARKLIEKVRVAGRGPKTGYDRDQFGSAWTDSAVGVAWARNGCDTRDDILHRDLSHIAVRSGTHGCVVTHGTYLVEPYTGKQASFDKAQASALQIDHVIALSFAWQMGAAHWKAAKRVQLANDPLNLLASNGSLNMSKGDAGPAAWLPPNKTVRCAYSVRAAQVAVKYDLALPKADKAQMLHQCA
jgi:hypothetical protein